MLVLDLKRTREDFLKKKGKSSADTLRSYTNIFNHLEKFCLKKYDTSLENIIEELAIVENPQEQTENLIQTYIDELEFENKPLTTVRCYSCMAKNYLKYRRVQFDKDELETSISLKSEIKEELYPISKKEIKTLLDIASLKWKIKILMMLSGGFRISELLGVRKSDIDTSLERYAVHIRAEFAKGNKARTTIISKEAMEYLDKLLENKTDNDFLFPHNSSRIAGTTTEIITFRGLVERAGLNMKYDNKRTHKITTHSFRAFFISQFEKTSSGFGHALSGHGRYLKQYERFTMTEKLEKYLETEKHLLIFSNNESEQKLEQDYLQLKAKVARLEELINQQGIKLS